MQKYPGYSLTPQTTIVKIDVISTGDGAGIEPAYACAFLIFIRLLYEGQLQRWVYELGK